MVETYWAVRIFYHLYNYDFIQFNMFKPVHWFLVLNIHKTIKYIDTHWYGFLTYKISRLLENESIYEIWILKVIYNNVSTCMIKVLCVKF